MGRAGGGAGGAGVGRIVTAGGVRASSDGGRVKRA